MSQSVHLDFETFSTCDLKDCGLYKYAEHESTEILVACYAFDEEDVQTWVPGRDGPVPQRLREHIESGKQVCAHNYNFERIVSNGTAGRKAGFPALNIAQGKCTMVKCAANGLPRGLGDAADALGTAPKDDSARITMLQLSKPKKPTKANPATRYARDAEPEKFAILDAYCADDVRAERAIDDAVPDLIASEQRLWELDAKINDAGIQVDLDAVVNIMAVVDEYKAFLADACEKATRPESNKKSETVDWLVGADGYPELLDPRVGLKPTQRDKIAEWVRANGYPKLLDMQADTVKSIIADDSVPDPVKHVLRIYSTFNAKAISKFNTILDMVCADGRLHGMFVFNGANTGRWSSTGVQLQNLSRGYIDDPNTAIEAFSARSLAWVKALYPDVDPIKVAASCVRGTLVAAPGTDLLFPDFASIESRGGAWLFDEEWKLEAFRKYDIILRDEQTGEILLDKKGEPLRAGPDNYKLAYSRSFGTPVDDVTKPQRQVGKVKELFMQYEGGVGAFVTGAETYGIDLDELARTVLPNIPPEIRAQAEKMWTEMPQHRAGVEHDVFIACDSLKRMWRNTHPKIRQGWRDLKEAAEQAVQNAGKGFAIPNGKIAFKVVEYKGRRWLYMRLPSGRRLPYYNPRWIEERTIFVKKRIYNQDGTPFDMDVEEVVPGEMRYWGTDTYTRRWMEVSTYGGKLCENAVQALSRDLLASAMFKLDAANYEIVGTVHDEVICEVPEDFGSFEHAGELMCEKPAWAAGFPVAVDGQRQKRYAK